MKFSVVTLFPDLIASTLAHGLLGQALVKGHVEVGTVNPRAYTEDAHHTVDDRVFGGGDGMAMKVEPLARAVTELRSQGFRRVVVLSPQGRVWSQSRARAWAGERVPTVLICGRYAGIDHRFTVKHADEEISLGDFILNGGEIAALALIESVARLIPGVLGNQLSSLRDSFSEAGLECPHFTRPREVEGLPVPSPLLSGNHARIAAFEKHVGLVRTQLLRPDLLDVANGDLEAAVAELGRLNDSELHALGLTRGQIEELL